MVISRYGAGKRVEAGLVEQIYSESRLHGVLDHADQPHLAAVVRRVDAGYPALAQMANLMRQDGPSPSTEQEDVAEARLV